MPDPRVDSAARARLLDRARSRCFFLDLGDAGAFMCRANMPFGLAKIHWLQESLGIAPDASWITTPDSTVTRNLERWASGFGYGGALEWSGDFVPLEIKPNCCGMLVAGLDDLPPADLLARRVSLLSESPITVGDVQAHWDMHKGNHFLNVYSVPDPSVTSGLPFVAIMHSSGSELRGPNRFGPGLYLGSGNGAGLDAIAERAETPFGPAPFLRGDAAASYVEFARRVEAFAADRRHAYAARIFGDDVHVLFNQMHQGMDGSHRMLLGCYRTDRPLPGWVPVTLRGDLPAYLVAPLEIYSEAILAHEGLLDRARTEDCMDRLTRAALLPHGGGYHYPDLGSGTVEVDDQGMSGVRLFRVPGRTDWFKDVRDLPYTYRGEEVIRRIESLGAGRVASRLEVVLRLEG